MSNLASAADVGEVTRLCGEAALAGVGGAIAVECVLLLLLVVFFLGDGCVWRARAPANSWPR
jgi:hypothetical protein